MHHMPPSPGVNTNPTNLSNHEDKVTYRAGGIDMDFNRPKRIVLQVVCVCGMQEIRCLEREREALLQFKSAIVDYGGMLSSWTTAADCCHWEGIRCSNLTGHVLMLHLHGEAANIDYDFYDDSYDDSVDGFLDSPSARYISGEIHESLMELHQLKHLNLSQNYFQDSHIPHFFGSFTNLISLDLSYSGFRGKIPCQIGSLSHLKYLNLAGNFLEGSIPYQLGKLFKLQHLDLSNNNLEGNIPSELGKLSKLQKLFLGGFEYDGTLKIDVGNHHGGQWLSNLSSLTYLYLHSISNLESSHHWLRMIGKLPNLKELALIGCNLSDHFILSMGPSKFNFSTSLSAFDLSDLTTASPHP
ncbi:hypothetical protein RJT34_19546 [Clitoria ternatea]|uniref:Leucine-rich repeat-containing N-terminal plant-type domain-containing protein n=1 Tax=Clitoria ternatea TaxID=43366 RepID=A0AAN9P3M9_CLITE